MSNWMQTAVHDLDNGWRVIEYDHKTFGAFVSAAQRTGIPMRAVAQITYVPSERIVWCLNFVGSSRRDRAVSARVALANARRGAMVTHAGCWKRRRRSDGRTWKYTVSIGDPIDMEYEFEEIVARLEDEAFEAFERDLSTVEGADV